jgi:hypothetical protein
LVRLHILGLAQLPAQPPAFLIQHVAQEPRPAHDPRQLCLLAKADSLGQLVTDEAATHHEHALRLVRLLDERIGVVEGLKAQARGHLFGTRPWRWLGPAAGGDEQGVVRKFLTSAGAHDLASCIDLGCPGLEMDLQIPIGIVLDGAHQHLFAAHLPAKIAWQRDAVVEGMSLGRDHDDRCVGVSLAKLLSASLAGDAVADDDISTSQLEKQSVDVGAVVVIREIVSGSGQVIGRWMVARQRDRHVV